MNSYETAFGSLSHFEKGGVEIVDDDPRNYAFSNVFEVCLKSRPYERVAIAKNLEYVIEAVRAEGTSDWYAARHDEFVLSMDGEVEIQLVKLEAATAAAIHDDGAHRIGTATSDIPMAGKPMGRIVLRRGHQALLPAGAAYRFKAARQVALVVQTIAGPETVEKWADICQTEDNYGYN